MNLLNNKIFLILLIVGLVIGLLALAQVMDNGSITSSSDYDSDNPQYNAIRKEVDKMSTDAWDKTIYYRIKNSIKDYKDSKQLDAKMEKELSELLNNKYMLKLSDAAKQFCATAANMSVGNELQAEANNFSQNSDIKPTLAMLEDYRYTRAIAAEASKYGKNEQFDEAKSSNYEAVLNNLPNKVFFKDNPTVKNEAEEGLQALGLVRGLDKRFKETDLSSCDCAARFGRNIYYKEACDKAQAGK
jgi:hypothetical protein